MIIKTLLQEDGALLKMTYRPEDYMSELDLLHILFDLPGVEFLYLVVSTKYKKENINICVRQEFDYFLYNMTDLNIDTCHAAINYFGMNMVVFISFSGESIRITLESGDSKNINNLLLEYKEGVFEFLDKDIHGAVSTF